MKLEDVHHSIHDLETYLSRSNDKKQDIELLKLAVFFDISESLKTISETLTDPDYVDGVIDNMQRIYSSIDELSSDITDNFEEFKKVIKC